MYNIKNNAKKVSFLWVHKSLLTRIFTTTNFWLKVHVIGQVRRVHEQVLQGIHHSLEHVLTFAPVRRTKRRWIIRRIWRGGRGRGWRARGVRWRRHGGTRRVLGVIGGGGGDSNGWVVHDWLIFIKIIIMIRAIFAIHLVCKTCRYFKRCGQSFNFLHWQRAITRWVEYTARAIT